VAAECSIGRAGPKSTIAAPTSTGKFAAID
jgi:hypothetical protein